MTAPPTARPSPLPPVAAFAAALALYAALPAGTINGDGLGYYWTARSDNWAGKFLPGHLLYCPLMAALGAAVPGVALPRLMLAVNQLAGAAGVGLLVAAAGRLGLPPLGRAVAGVGLAASFGYWQQAIDVETYALANLGVVAAGYCLVRYAHAPSLAWAAAAGAATAAAGLFHLATLAFGLAGVVSVLLAHAGRWRDAARPLAAYVLAAALTFGVPLAVVMATVVRPASPADVAAWLKSADHGFRAEFGLLSVPRAAFGFVRAFVPLESFWNGPRAWIAVKVLAVLAAAAWVGWRSLRLAGRTPAAARPVAWGVGLFALAQAALGTYYFGSDSERWVFLLPWAWLCVGAGVDGRWQMADGSERRDPGSSLPSAICLLPSTLLAVNLATGVLPLASDRAAEGRVRALAEYAGDGAVVVVTPGHDWTSYLTFYRPEAEGAAKVVSLINLALKHPDDPNAVLAEAGRRVEAARRAGVPVVVVRALDPADDAREDPWPGLAGLGCRPDRVRAWLRQYRWESARLADPAGTRVWRLAGGPDGLARAED